MTVPQILLRMHLRFSLTVTLCAASHAFLMASTENMIVTSITPVLGHASGGTFVTLYGSNFVSGITCRFGTVATATPATTLNSSVAVCVSPALSLGISVPVEVSDDAQTFTSWGVGFLPVGAYRSPSVPV